MSAYLVVKWLHILSSVLLVGTGFGSAYYMFFTNRSGDVATQATVTRLVVRADWWFTSPTVLLQPVTGFALVYMAGWPLTTPWLVVSIALFLLAGACWLPAVWLQVRMAAMAREAAKAGHALPAAYWRYARWWEMLGYPAFAAMVAVFFLMVTKPALLR